MPTRRTDNVPPVSKKRGRPAKTPEARENQLIALAIDLAEKQLRDGTASTPLINHYIKLGTTRERLEQEKLAYETELLKARKEALDSAKNIESLYAEALQAMRAYQGQPVERDDEYED